MLHTRRHGGECLFCVLANMRPIIQHRDVGGCRMTQTTYKNTSKNRRLRGVEGLRGVGGAHGTKGAAIRHGRHLVTHAQDGREHTGCNSVAGRLLDATNQVGLRSGRREAEVSVQLYASAPHDVPSMLTLS
eukprot:171412-Rhodomonas_salina.3